MQSLTRWILNQFISKLDTIFIRRTLLILFFIRISSVTMRITFHKIVFQNISQINFRDKWTKTWSHCTRELVENFCSNGLISSQLWGVSRETNNFSKNDIWYLIRELNGVPGLEKRKTFWRWKFFLFYNINFQFDRLRPTNLYFVSSPFNWVFISAETWSLEPIFWTTKSFSICSWYIYFN